MDRRARLGQPLDFPLAQKPGVCSRKRHPHNLGHGRLGLTDQTDTYALSISFAGATPIFGASSFGIAAANGNGKWVNAVDLNYGQNNKRFIVGPWKPGYPLGYYGIDSSTNTAWAVINYNSDFAVGRFEQ